MKENRVIIMCVALLGCHTSSMNGTTPETYPVYFQPASPIIFKTVPQTIEEQILSVLIDKGYSICEQVIILAQSKHESGHYRNSISKKNNVFSLHKRKKSIYVLPAKVLAEGCTCFAAYRSIEDATLDYLQYRDGIRVSRGLSVDEFVSFIKSKNYFTDNEQRYLASMKRLIARDDTLVANFNARYQGCPEDTYPSEKISTFHSNAFTPVDFNSKVLRLPDVQISAVASKPVWR